MTPVHTRSLTEASGLEEALAGMLGLAREANAAAALCINPRRGDLPRGLRRGKSDLAIDSFVSDEEWREAARLFSRTVFAGDSHHPLASCPESGYDLVLVCEEFSRVDDCDAMAEEYFRLLRPGGRLLSPLWNMSDHRVIDAVLNARPFPAEFDHPLHGRTGIPLASLRSRLEEIGFAEVRAHARADETADVSRLQAIAKSMGEMLVDEHFKASIFLLEARKGKGI